MRRTQWHLTLALAAGAVTLAWTLSKESGSGPGDLVGDGGASERSIASGPGLAANPRMAATDGGREKQTENPPPATPIGESRIAGTVRRDGRPSAARVELHRVRPWTAEADAFDEADAALEEVRSVALTTLDAGDDGRFAFSGMEPGSYVVRAFAADGASGSMYAQVHSPGARQAADVDIETRTASLRGRVTHADGTPWRGDVLVHASMTFTRAHVGAGKTDAEGRFTISQLPAGSMMVSALAPNGSRVLGPDVLLPTENEYTIVWEADRIALEGQVLAATDRTPIAGAEVVGCESQLLGGTSDKVRTGEDGRFRVWVPKENGSVRAVAVGFAPTWANVESRSEDVVLVLTRAARITGIVTRRGGGGPVTGAKVSVISEGERAATQRRRDRSVETDGEGRFVVEDVVPGSYVLVARGDGRVSAALLPTEHAARAAGRVTLGPGADVEVVIETVGGGRIVGTVRDADGDAVHGATVFASRPITARTILGSDLPIEAYGYERAASGMDGRFEISALVPGVEYVVSADAAGHPDSPELRVTATNDTPRPVDLVFPRARWIEITVVDDGTEQPIAGALLIAIAIPERLEDEDGIGFGSYDAAPQTTGPSGRARFGPLGDGEIQVSAYALGFTRREFEEIPDLVEGPNGLSATIRMQRARSITGRVLRPDGEPAAGATVTVSTPDAATPFTGLSVTTERDGTFTIDGPRQGGVTLRARIEVEGLVSNPVETVAGAVGLTLQLAARIVVAEVVDPDGNAVPGAKAVCTYKLASGGYSRVVHLRVENGRLPLEMEDPAPGTSYDLHVSEAIDANGEPLPLAEAHVKDLRPGQPVVVRLSRERTIEGRVLDANGDGVPGARVQAVPVASLPDGAGLLEATWAWSGADVVRTDAKGAFRIGRLGDGLHYVAVLPHTAFAPPTTLRRDAGVTGVDFRLRAATSATITVTRHDGGAVEGAEVVAIRNGAPGVDASELLGTLFTSWPSAWSTSARTGADGKVVLVGLDPDATFHLGVRGPPSFNLATAITRTWHPSDTAVRLAAGLTITGFARDAAGKPLPGTRIHCVDALGLPHDTVAGKDGAFSLAGLDAGTLQLQARFLEENAGELERKLRSNQWVRAGAEGIDLRLR